MRSIRLLTIVALMLSLPTYGVAAAVYAHACSMQPTATDSSGMGADCCPQKHHASHPPCGSPDGKSSCDPSCAFGHGCNGLQALDRVTSISVSVVYSTDAASRPVLTLPVSHSPNGLWRPPRLI